MKRPVNSARVIHRVVKRLREAYHPTQVILFGSYAEGCPTNDSDIDLLVVKETAKSFYQRLYEARRLVSPVLKGHPVDLIVVTPGELKR